MAKKTEKDEPMMDLGIEIPNIPMPEQAEESDEIEDECDAAYRFAFIGAGQAGARMAETFWKTGYRRVCAINTTMKDLVHIDIPEDRKLVMEIDEDGAGKDPAKGEMAAKKYYEDIYDLMRRSFGSKFDRIMVLAGAGGGTGTGTTETMIKIAHDIAQSFRLEQRGQAPQGQQQATTASVVGTPAVGVLVSLPMVSEGQKVNANAIGLLESLFTMVGKDGGKLAGRSISPLIIADNERIDKIYPKRSVSQFYGVANQSIVGLFHLFNSIATKASELTTFDQADFGTVLGSGVLTFGACPIAKWDSPTDISYAIRDNLRKNVLVADLDLDRAATAACIFVGHPEVLDAIPQRNLEHGFEMLSRTMQDKSIVHRGIYRGNVIDVNGKPGLVVYTLIGELGRPDTRMDEMYRVAGIAPKK